MFFAGLACLLACSLRGPQPPPAGPPASPPIFDSGIPWCLGDLDPGVSNWATPIKTTKPRSKLQTGLGGRPGRKYDPAFELQDFKARARIARIGHEPLVWTRAMNPEPKVNGLGGGQVPPQSHLPFGCGKSCRSDEMSVCLLTAFGTNPKSDAPMYRKSLGAADSFGALALCA